MTQHLPAKSQRLPPPLPVGGSFREPFRPGNSGRIGHSGSTKIKNEEVVDLTDNDYERLREETPVKRRRLNTESGGDRSPAVLSDGSQGGNGGSKVTVLQRSHTGRPSWQFPFLRPSEDDKNYSKKLGFQSLPPLPPRPGKHIRRDGYTSSKFERDRSIPKREVETCPYRMVAPGDAPLMHDNDYLADFFPWKGCHSEDNLAREFVRDGFYDKSKFPLNLPQSRLAADNAAYGSSAPNPGSHENVSSARGFQKSFQREPPMLSCLNAVFMAVLERRQSHGKMSSGSSFKPPPRVTLTEAKRKSWLSDLANPTVPLRRLSRTIPQGIRGQPLLEQCLVNGIPIGRATWFAKCVGANEIRTLKRKGTSASFAASAETKWLREWTSNIEALLESNVTTCGMAGWRPKTNFCIELGTRFYDENLLDREHYLDWVVKALSRSSLDRLPIWMMFVHIHASDLGRFRKRGRLLAETLLDKLRVALDDDVELLRPLIEKVSSFVKSFVKANPACFLLPRSWNRHRDTLQRCLDLKEDADRDLFDALDARNARIVASETLSSKRPISSVQTIIGILDNVKPPYILSEVSSLCLETEKDSSTLISNLLQWSTTRFRTGLYRQYLAVCLLRKWNKQGLDIEVPIYNMVGGYGQGSHVQLHSLYKIVGELVRSKTFSVSRYLQWLTAQGASARLDSPEFQLLVNLPVQCLPEHVKNLRSAMLARAGVSMTAQSENVQQVKRDLAHILPIVFKGLETVVATLSDLEGHLSELNGSAKFEISYWVRANVAEHYQEPTTKSDGEHDHVDTSKLTLSEFEILRGVLESFSDMPILADFIYDASNSDDDSVLAAATDTLNRHSATFSILGAFDELHQLLFRAYQRLRTTGPSMRNLTISLIDLASQKPSDICSIKGLQSDLARGERNAAVAACSPISDHMAETLHSAGSSFNEEFEQLLTTGNSIDDQTLASLFRALTTRLETGNSDKKNSPELLCQMLCRLRAFRPKQFDSLMNKWLERLLQNTNQLISRRLVLAIISFGCTNFRMIFMIGKDLLSADAARPGIVNGSAVRSGLSNVFDLWCQEPSLPTPSLRYRFRLLQHKYVMEYSAEALEVLRLVSWAGSNALAESLLLKSLGPSGSDLTKLFTSDSSAYLSPALNNALQCPKEDGLSAFMITVPQMEHAIRNCNEYSMPLVQLYIQVGLQEPTQREALINVIFEFVQSRPQPGLSGSSGIHPLLSTLGSEASWKVREKAEQSFFTMSPPYTSVFSAMDPDERVRYQTQAANYLSIVDAAACNSSTHSHDRDISIGPIFVEKLSGFLRYLAQQSQSTTAHFDEKSNSLHQVTATYLTHLLDLISLHRDTLTPSSPNSPSTATAQKPDQSPIKILIALLSIATNSSLNTTSAVNSPLTTYILDISALLVDGVSSDHLSLASRFLKDRAKDPRAEFLLGNMNSVSPSFSVDEGGAAFLAVKPDGSGTTSSKVLGEWRPKPWEMLEGGSEPSLGLGLFAARKAKA